MTVTDPTDQVGTGDSGATAVEYALLIVFIAVVIFGAVYLVGQDVIDLYERANWWSD